MPPNRFESEVESFLEGSHGDRTHIKRADHPRLHHYAGRYSTPGTKLAQHAPLTGSIGTKLALHGAFLGQPGTKLAQHALKRRFSAIFRALGEFSHAQADNKPSRANFFAHRQL